MNKKDKSQFVKVKQLNKNNNIATYERGCNKMYFFTFSLQPLFFNVNVIYYFVLALSSQYSYNNIDTEGVFFYY